MATTFISKSSVKDLKKKEAKNLFFFWREQDIDTPGEKQSLPQTHTYYSREILLAYQKENLL